MNPRCIQTGVHEYSYLCTPDTNNLYYIQYVHAGVECDRPPKPSYGLVKFWTTTPGSKAFYGCFNGYQLSGYAVRFCQGNGYWSGRTPSCRKRHY